VVTLADWFTGSGMHDSAFEAGGLLRGDLKAKNRSGDRLAGEGACPAKQQSRNQTRDGYSCRMVHNSA
jgi:hypothetical protein